MSIFISNFYLKLLNLHFFVPLNTVAVVAGHALDHVTAPVNPGRGLLNDLTAHDRVGTDQNPMIEDPDPVIEDPDQVIEDPDQVIEDQGLVIACPGQVIADPCQAIADHDQVTADQGHLTADPSQVSGSLGQRSEGQGQRIIGRGRDLDLIVDVQGHTRGIGREAALKIAKRGRLESYSVAVKVAALH